MWLKPGSIPAHIYQITDHTCNITYRWGQIATTFCISKNSSAPKHIFHTCTKLPLTQYTIYGFLFSFISFFLLIFLSFLSFLSFFFLSFLLSFYSHFPLSLSSSNIVFHFSRSMITAGGRNKIIFISPLSPRSMLREHRRRHRLRMRCCNYKCDGRSKTPLCLTFTFRGIFFSGLSPRDSPGTVQILDSAVGTLCSRTKNVTTHNIHDTA